jgi:hypothetical protein
MTVLPKAKRRTLQRNAKAMRQILEEQSAKPRDARAWARYDRLMLLLSELEREPPNESLALMRLVEEIDEWWEREETWRANYPVLNPPADWTRRELTPAAERRLDRKLRALVKAG